MLQIYAGKVVEVQHMGQITSLVLDAAEIWAYECMLPDDWPVSQLTARFAELANLPSTGPDGHPMQYGFVQLNGSAVDPDSRLADLELAERPVFRIVPEITAAQDTLDFSFDEPPAVNPNSDGAPDVVILNQKLITEDVQLDLKVDVRIDATVHRQIEEFAGRDRQKECIGLLLGTVTTEDRARVLHIKAALPAYDAHGSRTDIKLGLHAWDMMLSDRDKRYGKLGVLGWFHSHAGWGVFMSDADVFIQRHFFRHPNMVAYVLDPTKGKDGFFYWHEGKIGLCSNYGLVGSEAAVRRQSKGKRRISHTLRNIVIVIALAAMLCAAVLYKPVSSKLLSIFHPAHKVHTGQQRSNAKPVEIKTQVYTLQRGESLWSVCKRFYGDARLARPLAEYNKIDDINSLQIGREITIPPKEELESR